MYRTQHNSNIYLHTYTWYTHTYMTQSVCMKMCKFTKEKKRTRFSTPSIQHTPRRQQRARGTKHSFMRRCLSVMKNRRKIARKLALDFNHNSRPPKYQFWREPKKTNNTKNNPGQRHPKRTKTLWFTLLWIRRRASRILHHTTQRAVISKRRTAPANVMVSSLRVSNFVRHVHGLAGISMRAPRGRPSRKIVRAQPPSLADISCKKGYSLSGLGKKRNDKNHL